MARRGCLLRRYKTEQSGAYVVLVRRLDFLENGEILCWVWDMYYEHKLGQYKIQWTPLWCTLRHLVHGSGCRETWSGNSDKRARQTAHQTNTNTQKHRAKSSRTFQEQDKMSQALERRPPYHFIPLPPLSQQQYHYLGTRKDPRTYRKA